MRCDEWEVEYGRLLDWMSKSVCEEVLHSMFKGFIQTIW